MDMKVATSIQDVIIQLDDIIIWSKKHQSRMGYFAILYKKMTVAVLNGINAGQFENPEKMVQLDVNFANRYLTAFNAYINKQPCTNSWLSAFNLCNSNKLIVLQHLLLGINTHINLDLAIAAAQTSPGNDIHDLKKDFDKINDVIQALTQSVQETLSNIWFPLRALTKISNGKQESVINFSIKAARQASWSNAVALATISGAAHENYITMIDKTVATVAYKIANPGIMMVFLLQPVRLMEPKLIGDVIAILEK